MNITFRGDNIELTDEMKHYATEKVSMLKKFFTDFNDEDLSCEVILGKQNKSTGDDYRADFTIFAGSMRKHAVGHGESITAAIDIAKDELARRIRREKKKEMSLLKRGKRALKKMVRWGE